MADDKFRGWDVKHHVEVTPKKEDPTDKIVGLLIFVLVMAGLAGACPPPA